MNEIEALRDTALRNMVITIQAHKAPLAQRGDYESAVREGSEALRQYAALAGINPTDALTEITKAAAEEVKKLDARAERFLADLTKGE